jgi:hypothetical protein
MRISSCGNRSCPWSKTECPSACLPNSARAVPSYIQPSGFVGTSLVIVRAIASASSQRRPFAASAHRTCRTSGCSRKAGPTKANSRAASSNASRSNQPCAAARWCESGGWRSFTSRDCQPSARKAKRMLWPSKGIQPAKAFSTVLASVCDLSRGGSRSQVDTKKPLGNYPRGGGAGSGPATWLSRATVPAARTALVRRFDA